MVWSPGVVAVAFRDVPQRHCFPMLLSILYYPASDKILKFDWLRQILYAAILCFLTNLGCFPFTSPRRPRRRQTWQCLFTLPKSPAGDVLSINGNSDNAGDTGFAVEIESSPNISYTYPLHVTY